MASEYLLTKHGPVVNLFKMGECIVCGQHTLVRKDDGTCQLAGCLADRK